MRILYKIANKLFRIVKKILKLLTSRMVIIGVALLLEFCWLAGIVMQLNEKSVYINYAVTILSLIAVLSIINNPKMNPGYKLMVGSLYPGASGNRNLPVRHSRPFQCGKKIPYTLRYSSAFAGRRSWRGRRDA